MKKILIVNSALKQCGVYQYGLNVALALRQSKKYHYIYTECVNQVALFKDVVVAQPDAIIFNYYPILMKWLTPLVTRSFGIPVLGTFHEVNQREADAMTAAMFDIHLCLDPDVKETNPVIKGLGRIIPPYHNTYSPPAITTIGAFGFGMRDQGYETVINKVQEEYEVADINLHLPFNDVVDRGGRNHALKTAELCKKLVTKPGIKLNINHDFMEKEYLLDYLAGNTANAFFRDNVKKSGKSSALDFGLAVNRPVLLTKCSMYSHLFKTTPSPFIDDRPIKEIIASGTDPLKGYYSRWTERQFANRMDSILDGLL